MTPAELSRTVLATVRRAVEADELSLTGPVPERVVVRRPPRPGCGDYATNVALQLAPLTGAAPLAVADVIGRRLAAAPGIARVDVAAPGFLNITLQGESHEALVDLVREQGHRYGVGEHQVGDLPAPTGEPRADAYAAALHRLHAATGIEPPAPRPHPVRQTPDELLRTLGADATAWALLRPPAEDAPRTGPAEHLAQREGNPLFLVRYAHARSRALLRNAHDLGLEPGAASGHRDPAETELLGLIADFPRTVEAAARHGAPDRVARLLERTADALLRFHDACPALPKGEEKPSAVHGARLALADAAGTVLANGLTLLGISAPRHL
ncbi:DALR anticodon-binding domain-containing protein [Actinacidiphila glaucinigra]|uniref:ArgS-related anticodon-binding protein NrtL n=1 Tax=Actinacidiphila glaucinigra TaxID=235986 RepID=UPI002DDA4570|nr:DALR anticodon-binding domain-containing protein [Actinacidiphila glaucinigra]WSD60103.1 DALR anticodon-binding domain-containing protein [Actinacidiphila glaucinigra]